MTKWIYTSKYQNAPYDEEMPEKAHFWEVCKGVAIKGLLEESDDQETCYWQVLDDNVPFAQGVEHTTEEEWAVDIAERKASIAIMTQRVPSFMVPQLMPQAEAPVRPMRPARNKEQNIAIIADWNRNGRKREAA